MKKQLPAVFLLLAGAGALGWYWWRRNHPGAAGDAVESPAFAGEAPPQTNIGQVGSTTQQEVSADTVRAALGFSEDFLDKTLGCFSYQSSDHASWYWKNGYGQTDITPAQVRHPRACGNSAP